MEKRTFVIISLLVPALLLFGSVNARAQALSYPQFGDAIHDYGVDLDNDGHFDELRVDFTARISENATYGFEAFLGNDLSPTLAHDDLKTNLTIGDHVLTVKFLGPYLSKANAYGPYVVKLQGSVYVGNARWSGSGKSYATSAYDPKSFDPPAALLGDQITDEGRDTNGDGQIDQIVVHVTIEAVKDVVVMASAYLSTNGLDGWANVQSPFGDLRHFPKGSWPMEFALDALPMYAVRANGPYHVDLSLFIEGFGPIDFRPYSTASYSYAALRRPSADFRAPGPSIQLADLDGNGLAELLLVEVPLRVTEAGDFSVQTNLWVSGDAGGFFQSVRAAHLEVGDRAVEVPFSGIAIRRAGATAANWTFEARLNRVDASEYDRNRTSWSIAAIDLAKFESRPVAVLSGSILPFGDPHFPVCRIVSILDPTTKFAAEETVYSNTYSITAFPANFTVLVRSCGTPTRSMVSTVNLAFDTSVNLTLGSRGADATEADLNLTTWKSAHRVVHSTLFDHAAQDRFLGDELGNRDGFADAAELHVVRAMQSPYFSRPFPLGDLMVDGRGMPYRSILSFEVGGAGPIVSSADLTETLVADSWSVMDPIGTRHNVTLWFPYDGPAGTLRVTFHLPPSSTGTATPHGNVTVVPIGSSAWSIDPGTDPAPGTNPASGLHYGYATIDAVAPEGPSGAIAPIPIEWLLVSGVAAAVAAIGVAALWVLRHRRPPPDKDPGPKEP